MEDVDIGCSICKKPMLLVRNGKTVVDISCVKHGIKTGKNNHCRDCCPDKTN